MYIVIVFNSGIKWNQHNRQTDLSLLVLLWYNHQGSKAEKALCVIFLTWYLSALQLSPCWGTKNWSNILGHTVCDCLFYPSFICLSFWRYWSSRGSQNHVRMAVYPRSTISDSMLKLSGTFLNNELSFYKSEKFSKDCLELHGAFITWWSDFYYF